PKIVAFCDSNSDLDRTDYENKRTRINASSTSKKITAEDVEYILDLTNAITELQLQVEGQKLEILELRRRIGGYCEEIIRLKESYQEKCKENENLTEQ
ncbi:23209_t:CDS:2, partial [Dentiscutata erythropus]